MNMVLKTGAAMGENKTPVQGIDRPRDTKASSCDPGPAPVLTKRGKMIKNHQRLQRQLLPFTERTDFMVQEIQGEGRGLSTHPPGKRGDPISLRQDCTT
jgi:hypothetical protein